MADTELPVPGPGDETAPLSPEQIRSARLAQHLEPLQEFAGYKIQSELGRGAMGVVYKAYDRKLKRTVALKVLLSAEHASKSDIERFFREAESAARLQHPNIVPIHDLEVHEGRHFYTMDYIDGEPLDEMVKQGQLALEEKLQLFEKIALGLQHAHENSIIHRDLKPANIIVGADLEPKITDFGLAKVLPGDEGGAAHSGLTMSGAMMGTPYYESPEQAMGRSKEVDARSDIYSLGCILYELLTGIPPFVSSSAMEILRMQVEEKPMLPSQRGAKVPRDVETICMKCLEKEPEERYPSAKELAADVGRFLDGEAITARKPGVFTRFRRDLGRASEVGYYVLAVLAVGLLLILFARGIVAIFLLLPLLAILLSVLMSRTLRREKKEAVLARDLAIHHQREAQKAREQEEEHRIEAERERARAQEEAYRNGIARADMLCDNDDLRQASTVLSELTPNLRNWEYGHLALRTASRRLEEQWQGTHEGFVWSVAFSHDSKYLASASGDGTVKLWDVGGGERFRVFAGHDDEVGSVAFSPDDKHLVTSSRDGTVRLWGVATGQPTKTLEIKAAKDGARSTCFTNDGTRIATLDDSACWVILISVETGEEAARHGPYKGGVRSFSFSQDGNRLAVGLMSGEARVLDLQTSEDAFAETDHVGPVTGIAFLKDGDRLLTASADGQIKIWDLDSGKVLDQLKGNILEISGISLSSEAGLLAAGTSSLAGHKNNSIEMWSLNSYRHLNSVSVFDDGVCSVAFSPDGNLLAAGSRDASLKVWKWTTSESCHVLEGHNQVVEVVEFIPGTGLMATGGYDKTVRIWDVETQEMVRELTGHECLIRGMALSPDHELLAAGGSSNGEILLWEVGSGNRVGTMKGHEDGLWPLVFSSDGTELVSGGDDKTIRLWSIPECREKLVLKGHDSYISALAYTPVDAMLFSTSHDETARFWDLKTGTESHRLEDSTSHILTACYSPDGKCLATGDVDGVIAIWSVASLEKIQELRGHGRFVWSVRFTPDGTRLVSGSWDNTVRLWDYRNGRELLSLKGHLSNVYSVSVSQDGRSIASASADKTVRIWLTESWGQSEHISESTEA